MKSMKNMKRDKTGTFADTPFKIFMGFMVK
jgi:hypothetical protein